MGMFLGNNALKLSFQVYDLLPILFLNLPNVLFLCLDSLGYTALMRLHSILYFTIDLAIIALFVVLLLLVLFLLSLLLLSVQTHFAPQFLPQSKDFLLEPQQVFALLPLVEGRLFDVGLFYLRAFLEILPLHYHLFFGDLALHFQDVVLGLFYHAVAFLRVGSGDEKGLVDDLREFASFHHFFQLLGGHSIVIQHVHEAFLSYDDQLAPKVYLMHFGDLLAVLPKEEFLESGCAQPHLPPLLIDYLELALRLQNWPAIDSNASFAGGCEKPLLSDTHAGNIAIQDGEFSDESFAKVAVQNHLFQ